MLSSMYLTAGFAVALAVAGGSALAAGRILPNGESAYGRLVPAQHGAVVVDTATARSVNVRCGDTVTFVKGSERFSWRFDSVVHGAVSLSQIAPPAFADARIMVYVALNDSELGG